MNDNTKLDVLLSLEKSSITPVLQIARNHDITTLKTILSVKKCPYKMHLLQELMENDCRLVNTMNYLH